MRQVAARRDREQPGSQKPALRSYAALALLRQAALCLLHYGIRCSHAYLSQVRCTQGLWQM